MEHLTTAAERLSQARGLPAVLDAACDAFEAILQVIGDYEDTSATVRVPFLLAATQAANGRDMVLFAPALPPRALCPQQARLEERGSAASIGAAVAGLSRLLATRLAHAAGALTTATDRAACQDAARCAAQVHDLLTRGGR